MRLSIVIGGLAVLSQTACKSRFFSFSPEPSANPTAAATGSSADSSQSGQIAIGAQSSASVSGENQPLSAQKPAAYKPLQSATQKTVALGKTVQFEIDGNRVEVTFVSVLEDSRCPRNVVCIWEGQARLQFNVSIPSMNVSRTVEATLRAGHPQLGQVSIGAVAIDLIGLNPDTATNTPNNQRSSPEATIVVGKAP